MPSFGKFMPSRATRLPGEHFSSLQFHCEVPTLSVSCVGSFTFCDVSIRLMCSPDEYMYLSLRK